MTDLSTSTFATINHNLLTAGQQAPRLLAASPASSTTGTSDNSAQSIKTSPPTGDRLALALSVAPGHERAGAHVHHHYKRHRTTFNQYQLTLLEEAFSQNCYPSPALRELLAAQAQIDAGRIQVWFQNRRAKHKKQVNQAMRCFAVSTLANAAQQKQVDLGSICANAAAAVTLSHAAGVARPQSPTGFVSDTTSSCAPTGNSSLGTPPLHTVQPHNYPHHQHNQHHHQLQQQQQQLALDLHLSNGATLELQPSTEGASAIEQQSAEGNNFNCSFQLYSACNQLNGQQHNLQRSQTCHWSSQHPASFCVGGETAVTNFHQQAAQHESPLVTSDARQHVHEAAPVSKATAGVKQPEMRCMQRQPAGPLESLQARAAAAALKAVATGAGAGGAAILQANQQSARRHQSSPTPESVNQIVESHVAEQLQQAASLEYGQEQQRQQQQRYYHDYYKQIDSLTRYHSSSTIDY